MSYRPDPARVQAIMEAKTKLLAKLEAENHRLIARIRELEDVITRMGGVHEKAFSDSAHSARENERVSDLRRSYSTRRESRVLRPVFRGPEDD